MQTVQENISLLKYNTFGIDVLARYFFSFPDEACLSEILSSENSVFQKPFILGGGSNILFTKNVDGLVLKNEISGIEKINEDDEYVYIKAGGGVNWHSFVLHCINQQWAGVENLSLIPGNVGASPMQNIGAYGVEIKDVFDSLQAYDLLEKKRVSFNHADCEFGYRESVFKNLYKNRFVILNVTYRLRKNPVFNIEYGAIKQELEKMNIDKLSIEAISNAVIEIRSSKLPDPGKLGNAGSFFKNPIISSVQFHDLKNNFPDIVGYPGPNETFKLAAGWLIEHSGPSSSQSWKGYREGDAGCHEKQALVLVNYGNATGEQIFNLSEKILRSVQEKYGVTLEREVNIL